MNIHNIYTPNQVSKVLGNLSRITLPFWTVWYHFFKNLSKPYFLYHVMVCSLFLDREICKKQGIVGLYAYEGKTVWDIQWLETETLMQWALAALSFSAVRLGTINILRRHIFKVFAPNPSPPPPTYPTLAYILFSKPSTSNKSFSQSWPHQDLLSRIVMGFAMRMFRPQRQYHKICNW